MGVTATRRNSDGAFRRPPDLRPGLYTKPNAAASVAAIVATWGLIGIAGYLAVWSASIPVYVLAILVIGGRQHALLILAHDAAHHTLFRSKRANDIVGNLLLAYPFGLSLSLYRPFHLAHHRAVFHAPQDDPEIPIYRADPGLDWPKTRSGALATFARDLIGLNIASLGRFMGHFSPWFRFFATRGGRPVVSFRERCVLVGYGLTLAAVIYLTAGWVAFLLLWIAPILTVLVAVFRLRSISEHCGVPDAAEISATRTVLPSLAERFWIAPFNINYHIEHHLFPSAPWHKLPRLHRALRRDADFRENGHVVRGYLGLRSGVLAELTLPR